MPKTHVKQGDEVVILAGSSAGKRGRVLEVLSQKNRAVVEGQAMVKKHQAKTQDQPEGSIVEKEGSIHMSNLMLATKFDQRQERRQSSGKASS